MSAENYAFAAWTNAETHLREALELSPEATPVSFVHASYYAMFHAARAVLLRRSGSAPKKHGIVVEQFGFLVKDDRPELRAAASDLGKAQERRIRGDYKDTATIASKTAEDTLRMAVSFLQTCAAEFEFVREKARDGA